MTFSFWKSFSPARPVDASRVRRQRTRQPQIESCEKRELLAITTLTSDQTIVFDSDPNTRIDFREDDGIAMDSDGDFVVVYVKEEPVLGLDGTPTTDFTLPVSYSEAQSPARGRSVETNIYARYFTNDVQRITLPASAVGGAFALQMSPDEIVQRLTIASEAFPFSPQSGFGPNAREGTPSVLLNGNAFIPDFNVSGEIVLGIDLNGDAALQDDELVSFQYDMAAGGNGQRLQNALQALGGPLANAQVLSLNETEFEIHFAYDPAAGGPTLSLVSDRDLDGQFLARTSVFTTSGPRSFSDPLNTGSPIRFLNAGSPAATATQTATLIQLSMQRGGFDVDVIGRYIAASNEYRFDVEFIGADGRTDQPPLFVADLTDAGGVSLGDSNTGAGISVETVKEPSGEFRVNDPEPANPVTGETNKYIQGSPTVAMDPDGDFVIAWVSEVPDSVSFGSDADIYLKRFSSTGQQLSDQVLVNEFRTNRQYAPSIDMDQDGNFAVTWASDAQFDSFFVNVFVRWFDLEARPLGSSVLVADEIAETDVEPVVEVSPDGHTVVAWEFGLAVMLRGWTPDRAITTPTARTPLAFFDGQTGAIGKISLDSDAHNVFTAAWHEVMDPANSFEAPPALSTYTINNNPHNVRTVASIFRFNAAEDGFETIPTANGGIEFGDEYSVSGNDIDENIRDRYGWDQFNPTVGRDRDGDLFIYYEGYQGDPAEASTGEFGFDNTVVAAYQNAAISESQQIVSLHQTPLPEGTYELYFGNEFLGVFDYTLYETQLIQVLRRGNDTQVDTLGGYEYSIRFGNTTIGPFTFPDPAQNATPDEIADAEWQAVLAVLIPFLNQVAPGAVLTTTANHGTDVNGDTFLDWEFTIEYLGANVLQDVPSLILLPGTGAANAPAFNFSNVSQGVPVPAQIERQLKLRLARGDVVVTAPPAPDADGDGVPDLPDVDGDGIGDLPMTIDWGGSANSTNMPQVRLERTTDANGVLLNTYEEQTFTLLLPEPNPTGKYELLFNGQTYGPFEYTTAAQLASDVQLALLAATGDLVTVAQTANSGNDLNGDGVPDAELRIVFNGPSNVGVDQPLLTLRPARDEFDVLLPDALPVATTVSVERVKGVDAATLDGTAQIRTINTTLVDGGLDQDVLDGVGGGFFNFLDGDANGIAGFVVDATQQNGSLEDEPGDPLAAVGNQVDSQISRAFITLSAANAWDTGFSIDEQSFIQGNPLIGDDGPARFGGGTVGRITGNFYVNVPGRMDPIPIPFPDQTDPDWQQQLADAIEQALNIDTEEWGDPFDDDDDATYAVQARVVPDAEVNSWKGTPFEVTFPAATQGLYENYGEALDPNSVEPVGANHRDYRPFLNDIVVEITFTVRAEDMPAFFTVSRTAPGDPEGLQVDMGSADTDNLPDDFDEPDSVPATVDVQWASIGRPGIAQGAPTIGVEPDGDYSIAWLDNPEASGFFEGIDFGDGVIFFGLSSRPDQFEELSSGAITIGGSIGIGSAFEVATRFDNSVTPPVGGWSATPDSADRTLVQQQRPATIHIQHFDETTDTAGPRATDIAYGTGSSIVRIPQNGQLTRPLDFLVLSFDEDMAREGASSPVNTNNFELTKNGELIRNGIAEVSYGLNMAYDMGLGPRTNKYEAVLTLDANGFVAGREALTSGDFELTVKATLKDRAGNPLNRIGPLTPQSGVENGGSQTFRFAISQISGSETPVNVTQGGKQVASGESPQSVASDYDGDFVAVWTSDGSGSEAAGVYASIYTANVEGQSPSLVRQLLVSDDPTAERPSVGVDGDGDFVVTWSQEDAATSWDVWAQRFDKLGNARAEAFRVNTDTESIQRNSSVAMDADGDFVITWQSLGQEERDDPGTGGSGYGVYARRFDPLGRVVGAIAEEQVIEFAGSPQGGTFRLDLDGDLTAPITFSKSPATTAKNVEAALESLPTVGDVRVTAISSRQILVEFIGESDRRDIPLMFVEDAQFTPSGFASVTAGVDGSTGEFPVANTSAGDQMFPAVAMDASGDFVVTWTSYGQGNDAGFEGNVYARRFVSNETVEPRRQSTSAAMHSLLLNALLGTNYVAAATDGDDTPVLGASSNLTYAPGYVPDGSEKDFSEYNLFGGFKWGNPQFGTGATVTYSFVADGIMDPNNLDQQVPGFTNTQIDNFMPAGARAEIVAAFDAWSAVADITFFEVPDSGGPNGDPVADIRIFGHDIDPPNGPILAYAYRPPGGGLSDIAGDLHFDLSETWRIAAGAGLPGVQIRAVATHEIGHAIGLDHTGVPNSLMNPVYNESILTPQADDINGAVFLYGRARQGAIGAAAPEFLVNTTTASNQRLSSVALDADGDFAITWTSYGNDGGGNGYGSGAGGTEGVFVQRYNSDGTTAGGEVRVNKTLDRNQQASRISMDADGDFVVSWESFQDSAPGSDNPSSYGIFAQRFVKTSDIGSALAGPNGKLGGETQVNVTRAGDQRAPSVALSQEADFVVLWTGPGQGGTADSDVFFSRTETNNDDAGPEVTDVIVSDGAGGLTRLYDGQTWQELDSGKVNEMYIMFSEALNNTRGATAFVENFGNWQLRMGSGNTIQPGRIVDIDYGLNLRESLGVGPASGKYEVRLVFDDDPSVAGNQPLERGTYQLVALDRIQDATVNALDGDYDGRPGGNWNFTFSVGTLNADGTGGIDPNAGPLPDPPGDPRFDPDNPTFVDPRVNTLTTNDQDAPAVAMNDAGDYVAVWVSEQNFVLDGGDPNDTTDDVNVLLHEIVGQRFNNIGQPIGGNFLVASEANYVADANGIYTPPLPSGRYSSPDVAMDALGNFTVTWSGIGVDRDSGMRYEHEVWAKRYDFSGGQLDAEPIRVNQFTTFPQNEPSISMDDTGDFVVSWTSYNQDGDRSGVYARRYDSFGDPLSNEFRVNTTSANRQEASDVAMDPAGDFTVVWNSYEQDGSSWGVYGQRFSDTGAKLGGEFRVNNTTALQQTQPAIAVDDSGAFTVAWASFVGGASGNDVYARRYSSSGAAQGNEFRVNSTTAQWQTEPDVAVSGDGKIYITWQSFGQDGNQEGVYARLYNSGGSNYIDPETGSPLGEFRVNRQTLNRQMTPAIAADQDGDLVVVYAGTNPDGETALRPVAPGSTTLVQTYLGTEIFHRYMLVNTPASSTIDTSSSNFGAPANFTSGGGNNGGGGGGGLPGSWNNSQFVYDVNNDGLVTPVDVIIVVNAINATGSGALGTPPAAGTPGHNYIDVSGDNSLTPTDVLMVVNYINAQEALTAKSGAKTASVDAAYAALESSSDDEEVADPFGAGGELAFAVLASQLDDDQDPWL